MLALRVDTGEQLPAMMHFPRVKGMVHIESMRSGTPGVVKGIGGDAEEYGV